MNKNKLKSIFLWGMSIFLVLMVGGCNGYNPDCNCSQKVQKFHFVEEQNDAFVFEWEETTLPKSFVITITDPEINKDYLFEIPGNSNSKSIKKIDIPSYREGKIFMASIHKDCNTKYQKEKNYISEKSEIVIFKTSFSTLPPNILNLTQTNDCNFVTLSWNSIPQATHYLVYHEFKSPNSGNDTVTVDFVAGTLSHIKPIASGVNLYQVEAIDNSNTVVAKSQTITLCCIIIIDDDTEACRVLAPSKNLYEIHKDGVCLTNNFIQSSFLWSNAFSSMNIIGYCQKLDNNGKVLKTYRTPCKKTSITKGDVIDISLSIPEADGCNYRVGFMQRDGKDGCGCP